MATEDFTTSIQAPVSARDAYDKIARVGDWWAKDFKGSARQLGDTFTVRFGDTRVDFKISEAVASSKIVWLVTDCYLEWLQNKTEWNGTTVEWDILPGDSATTVTMVHHGLTPQVECYADCKEGWTGHIHNSLLQLLNTGKGMPE